MALVLSIACFHCQASSLPLKVLDMKVLAPLHLPLAAYSQAQQHWQVVLSQTQNISLLSYTADPSSDIALKILPSEVEYQQELSFVSLSDCEQQLDILNFGAGLWYEWKNEGIIGWQRKCRVPVLVGL